MADRRAGFRAAFTLVETLVAAGIVTVLAGLSVTVVSSGKQAGQASSCATNLRTLGQSVHLYVADYDDRLPFAVDQWVKDAVLHNGYNPPLRDQILAAATFDEIVAAYGGAGVAACPFDLAHPRARRGDEAPVSFYRANGTSYAYNAWEGLRSRPLASFDEPSRAPLLSDYDCYHRPEEDPHTARLNLLAADGNVRAVTCFDRVMRDLNRDY